MVNFQEQVTYTSTEPKRSPTKALSQLSIGGRTSNRLGRGVERTAPWLSAGTHRTQVERDFNLGLARLNICKQNRQKHQDRTEASDRNPLGSTPCVGTASRGEKWDWLDMVEWVSDEGSSKTGPTGEPELTLIKSVKHASKQSRVLDQTQRG